MVPFIAREGNTGGGGEAVLLANPVEVETLCPPGRLVAVYSGLRSGRSNPPGGEGTGGQPVREGCPEPEVGGEVKASSAVAGPGENSEMRLLRLPQVYNAEREVVPPVPQIARAGSGASSKTRPRFRTLIKPRFFCGTCGFLDRVKMVPATGFEPVQCYLLEPESSASANSATRAC